MKKILIAVLVIIVLFLGFTYLYIPAQIEFQVRKYALVNPVAASRVLSFEKNWKDWWPQQDKIHPADSIYTFNKSKFIVDRELYNAFNIGIVKNDDTIHSLFSLVPTSADSTQLQWSAVLNSTANPFKRLNKYWNTNETKKEMETILSSLVSFLQNQENIYGMQIKKEIVQDTLLVFREKESDVYPSTASIYSLVNTLKNQIKKAGANQTNPPMMNVIAIGPGKYRVMVAIPIDKEFALNDSLSFKRMVRGWILVSDVKGGPTRINQAIIEMRNFVNDYSKIPIALPFESMITDRMAEPDTSKWTTRLYFPIVL